MVQRLKRENHGFPLGDDTTLILVEMKGRVHKKYRYRTMEECTVLSEDVRRILSSYDYHQDETEKIVISLEEMIRNAITHGNGMDAKKSVSVTVDIDCQQAVFSIADEGGGFDPSVVADPVKVLEQLLDEDNTENYTHGRGIWIARHYMDSVEYNKKGNKVLLRKEKKSRSLHQP